MGATGSARTAYVTLGVGLVLVLVYAVSMDSGVGTATYLLVAAYATVLSVIGAARQPRASRRIWWAFAAAQVLLLTGDLLWMLVLSTSPTQPFPSIADVAYLAQYPVLALGMLWLVRGRRRGRDRAAFLDAAILTTGITVVGTVLFVAPAAESGGASLFSQVVSAAYPVGSVLVLALVARFFTEGVAGNASLWGLVGAVATLLVGDLVSVMVVVHGLAYSPWLDLGYLLSYLLLAFAIVHPSAHTLSEPAPHRSDRITGTRLALLGGALVLAPVTERVAHLSGVHEGQWVVLVGGCTAAVLVVLRLGDLVQDLQRTAVQLAALARKDALTGIPNRGTWDHELSRACAFARENDTPLTVALLDMDHFKRFNDTFGHVKGDLVLKETAAAWSSLLDGRGFVARFGGEEFTALIPTATADEVVGTLDQLRRAVTHDQTCSIGAATWDGVESPAELVARADRALYHAKRAGRDRIAVDTGQTATVVARSAATESTLRSLRSVYQPIADLRTGEVIGHEALSRFEGHEPREVFDRAARDGTAGLLESAAIRSALAGWHGEGLLTLNISPDALLAPELDDVLPEDLTGIVMEVTEADLAGYSAEMGLAIDRLRSRGSLIAIDDLGIGFSNVKRVVAIRPEIVKLDLSLIRGIDTDPMLQAVVAAVLLFAEQTGSQVIAEGIETEEERDCLVRLGVALGQGFLLGVPDPLPVVR